MTAVKELILETGRKVAALQQNCFVNVAQVCEIQKESNN